MPGSKTPFASLGPFSPSKLIHHHICAGVNRMCSKDGRDLFSSGFSCNYKKWDAVKKGEVLSVRLAVKEFSHKEVEEALLIGISKSSLDKAL